MEYLNKSLKIIIQEGVFKKDPETSELGRKIVGEGLLLINELGFEDFTFKKLGVKIQSNESSIYRYFESKHMLLLYLTCWYWSWMEYRLVFRITNIQDPCERLDKALEVLTETIIEDGSFSHIDERVLHRIIVNENSKSYLTKEVDKENANGYFSVYKRLILRVKDMIHDVNPSYPYSASLARLVVHGRIHQEFLKDHLPTMTDVNKDVMFNCLKEN